MSQAREGTRDANHTDHPVSAFQLSLIGGIITLAVTLLTINGWLSMYSSNGTNFGYSQWLLVASLDLSAMDGLALLIVGVVSGILIVVGAVLQHSGGRSKVKWGSVLVLAGTVIGIPTTSFGWFFGGLLSVLGAAFGLGWKPEVHGAEKVFPS